MSLDRRQIAPMILDADVILGHWAAGRPIPGHLAAECAAHVKLLAAEVERLGRCPENDDVGRPGLPERPPMP